MKKVNNHSEKITKVNTKEKTIKIKNEVKIF